MDTFKPWALCGLIFGPLMLVSHVKSSPASERVAQTAIILLAAVGVSLVCSVRLLSRYLDPNSGSRTYSSIPLDDAHDADAIDDLSGPSTEGSSAIVLPLPTRPAISQRSIAFVTLVLGLCLRVEVTRRLVRNIECPGTSFTGWLPFIFALVDYYTVQRHKKPSLEDLEIDESAYGWAVRSWLASPFRYLVLTALLSFSGHFLLSNLPSALQSTYICPGITYGRTSASLARVLSLPIDFLILASVDYICRPAASQHNASSLGPLKGVGFASIVAAFFTLLVGFLFFLFSPDDRHWILHLPVGFHSSIVKMFILCSIIAISACISMHLYASMITTLIALVPLQLWMSLTSSWSHTQPFPPQPAGSSFLSFTLISCGFLVLISTHSKSSPRWSRSRPLFAETPGWSWAVLVIVLLLRSVGWLAHKTNANFHPIDMLMFEAKTQHAKYVARAASSTDLNTTIEEYKLRHNRNPPPHFDKWYEYATSRKSAIIDDFDRVHEDLLPYWDLSPAEIRERTWKAISNPWNDVAGISVRNGKVDISPNVMPTHRWMLDGIISMMSEFGEFLPDMDLGFNLNDECRVAVPYETMEAMRARGETELVPTDLVRNSFSEERAATWRPIPEEPLQDRTFKEMSFQRTFAEFGSVSCPPGSPARSRRNWDTGHLCTSCTAPHSMGAFLDDWPKSADICHQPDMADLHGFYLSPAAFKATHELYPIFSQSKATGYHDILYPSPWNYMDKVKYDPNDENGDLPFDQKKKTLFWRGATSEGVSPGSGTWKGMSRQRFVHLANNINNTTPPQPILLPYPIAPSRDKYQYTLVPTEKLTKMLSTDVHIVNEIVRCGGRDCTEQSGEFAPMAQPTDFQAHWAYKYLLDLDGAGFSGRFLPFLFSRSLPFKAALFREWYDSRLTPWAHFVPLDLRGHGFWATLAYFAGLEGEVAGKRVSVSAHDHEAELIAEQGREWAGKVLRKEDMEIYFFRLLLEWGRLTDDSRDELGFRLG
ncbi:hypothetical protein AAFC00_001727 [Neodothiora populina]|uniref:Glycosyl transferase CAP10 domain-containing protein n=1 Tax=Neodothiora populina TaxID=2781224 RepID=A0ABR3PPY6_9PEZI